MLGSITARNVRDAAHALSMLGDQAGDLSHDARSTLSEVKTAAQTASIAFLAVTIVAVAALLIASAALVRLET